MLTRERAEMISGKFSCRFSQLTLKCSNRKKLMLWLVTTHQILTHNIQYRHWTGQACHQWINRLEPPMPTLKKCSVAEKNRRKIVTFQNRIWDKDLYGLNAVKKKSSRRGIPISNPGVLYWGFGGYGIIKSGGHWRNTGGGQLNDWGPASDWPDGCDLCFSVDSVWRTYADLCGPKEVDDHCMLLLRFKNGTNCENRPRAAAWQLRLSLFVCGTKGRYTSTTGKSRWFSENQSRGKERYELHCAKTGWLDFYKEYEKVFTKKVLCPSNDWEPVLLKLIEAARESARTGMSVITAGNKTNMLYKK